MKIIAYFFEIIIYFIQKAFKDNIDSDLTKEINILEVNALGDLIATFGMVNYIKNIYPDIKVNLVVSMPIAKELFHGMNVNIFVVHTPWTKRKNKYNIIEYIKAIKETRKVIKNINGNFSLESRGDIRKILFFTICGLKNIVSFNSLSGGNKGLHSSILLRNNFEYPTGKRLHRVEENILLASLFYNKQVSTYNAYNTPLLDIEYYKKFESKYMHITDFSLMIHLGAGSKTRYWPIKKWAKLIYFINKKYNIYDIYILSDDSEKELFNELVKYFAKSKMNFKRVTLNITDLMYFLGRIKLFIGSDSGPLHLADSLGCKVIGLYGCGIVSKWYPLNNGFNSVVESRYKYECCHYGKNATYQNDTEYCTKLISIKEVFNKLATLETNL